MAAFSMAIKSISKSFLQCKTISVYAVNTIYIVRGDFKAITINFTDENLRLQPIRERMRVTMPVHSLAKLIGYTKKVEGNIISGYKLIELVLFFH